MSTLDDLTYRELWRNIMHYRTGEFDRMPVIHWNAWDETFERWWTEGLPRHIDRQNDPAQKEFFHTVPQWAHVGFHCSLHPGFEKRVVEETDEYRVFREGSGVVLKDWKGKSCIPHYIDYTLKTAGDRPEFKKRLQPCPDRIPENLEKRIPMMKEGGFIMMPDHLITPGVPLEDYKYYLERIRELRL